MLAPEDLLAAKILYGKRADLRSVLSAALDTLLEDDTEQGLLMALVVREVISREEAAWIHERVQRYKRSTALGIYWELLVQSGLDGVQVQEAFDSLGQGADPAALGNVLVEAAFLDHETNKALSFQARQAFDQHLAEQVSSYSSNQEKAGDGPEESPGQPGGWTDSLPSVSSGVLRLAESTVIMERPPPPIDEAVRPPEFDVPSWVDTADERSGDTIAGYRVLGRIGRGAMGVVYLVDHHEAPQWPVALKLLLDTSSADSRGRFKRATLANGLCAHPGILGVFDSGETEAGCPYLAMEFFNGSELRKVLEADGKLETEQALTLAIRLFGALGAAHQAGVVHRDVKPENILVSSDYARTKLMDFGIATLPGVDEVEGEVVFRTMMSEEPQLVPGTPRYMSPEQASYQDAVGPESDVYSLGLILYEMLAGRVPFEADSAHGYMRCHVVEKPLLLAEAAPELVSLPSELHDLVASLLAKGPSKRPTPAMTVKILERVLRRLSGEPSDERPLAEARATEPTTPAESPSSSPIRTRKTEKRGLFGLFGQRRG